MKKEINKIIATVLLFFIFLLCLFFVIGIHQFRKKEGHLSWRYYVGSHRKKLVTVADIVYISPWMTFDYINKLFNIPQSYLEKNLDIHDSKYPFITVGMYAKKSSTNSLVLVEDIRNSIREYFTSSTPQ